MSCGANDYTLQFFIPPSRKSPSHHHQLSFLCQSKFLVTPEEIGSVLPLHTLCLCLPAAQAPILHRSTLCFCLPTQLLMHQCANTAPITSTSSAAKARVVSVTASSCSEAAVVQVYWQVTPTRHLLPSYRCTILLSKF